MGFRVVDQSSFVFRTDLPPSRRVIHPSGVIHAFRAPTKTLREKHLFAWVANSLKVDAFLCRLVKRGFDRSRGIVFIPYSTKENWLSRYPNAPLSMECTESGRVESCPTKTDSSVEDRNSQAQQASTGGGSGDIEEPGNGDSKKRKYRSNASMVQDRSLIPDPERDELHVEIYKYLKWLHGRLAEIEEKKAAAAALEAVSDMDGDDDEDNSDLDGEKVCHKRENGKKKRTVSAGVNVSELQGVLDKLVLAFDVIPNIRFDGLEENTDQEGECGTAGNGAPFLEEALGPALTQLVDARWLAFGKLKRRRRTRRPPIATAGSRCPGKFEEMLERMERFYEEHGHCSIATTDGELGNWVRCIREKRYKLLREGIDFEEVGPGRHLTPRMLTAERIQRLDAIGFIWSVAAPPVKWEDRFCELMDFYEKNGKWPTQSMGRLGVWVQKQRNDYAKKKEIFMKTRFPRLDEAGFEWTPKGYTKLSWDEGFLTLLDFYQANGHFDVPCPTYGEEDEEGNLVNKKSDSHKFYMWVESLHSLYRSYKLGRRSGILTEGRISLLMEHGFVFRDE